MCLTRPGKKSEWDTAVLTAEATSNYRRLRSKKEIFPFWEYKTVYDGKVREEHLKLHGVILPESDPRWNKIYPPNGWRCRCWVVGRMKHQVKFDVEEMRRRVDDFLETKEWKMSAAQGWGVNRCDSAQVFTADQMYINKFPGQSSGQYRKQTAPKWGLEPVPATWKKTGEDTPHGEKRAASMGGNGTGRCNHIARLPGQKYHC